MAGRTPYEAWANYIAPFREALRCIAPGRFVLTGGPQGIRVDVDYLVKLNNLNSVPLKGEPRILLVAGQTVRVEERPPFANQERYSIVTVAYTYGFSVVRGLHERELLTFHWNRDQRSVPRGHLHIGRGLLAQPTPIRPADFPKAHVPTGFVHFAAVVRFAITELGAMALTSDWDVILADAG